MGRAPDGRIVEAYGFDLSPIALRYDEFVRIAAEAAAERERMRLFHGMIRRHEAGALNLDRSPWKLRREVYRPRH